MSLKTGDTVYYVQHGCEDLAYGAEGVIKGIRHGTVWVQFKDVSTELGVLPEELATDPTPTKLIEKSGGSKYDGDKPAMGLIPPNAEIEIAKAFGYGARKYGQWNFLSGIEYTRLIGAVRRHINAFMQGEDIDPESGNHHLGHAMAGLAMCIEMQKVHPEKDDRFKGYETTANKTHTE